MPKKRTYNFKQLQGSSATNSQQAGPKHGESSSSPSVNERLSELRKLEGKDAAAKKRQLAESVNQRSVPPEVRGILGVPESAPPRAKAGVRFRDRMRTPGPAPPKSWLSTSAAWTPTLALRGARRGSKKPNANGSDRNRPKHLLRFARLAGLEGDEVDHKPSSLTDLALKTIAESWNLLDDDDYPALAEIPLHLRLRVISYITIYGHSIDSGSLQALLQGSEPVQQLDLAGLIGHSGLNLRKVVKLIERDNETYAKHNEAEVAESWDIESGSEAVLARSIQITRFSELTQLCVSHPAPTVSWRDLLALSKLTPQVTHLSLAYWPRPTLTPNLSTATVASQHSPEVTAGGSHYYSALDQDMSEPASLLRQLSGHLLCLEWLDLEGCAEWMPALTKLARELPSVNSVIEWQTNDAPGPSILVTNWKNLAHLRCAQGWLPSLIGIRAQQDRRDASAVDRVLIDGVTKHLQSVTGFNAFEATSDIVDVEKKKARIWLESEYKSIYASMQINSTRKAHGCKAVTTDFGWVQRYGRDILG